MPKRGAPLHDKPSDPRTVGRDLAGLLGACCFTLGSGLKFGIPVGLMVFGAIVLAFVAYDLWAAE